MLGWFTTGSRLDRHTDGDFWRQVLKFSKPLLVVYAVFVGFVVWWPTPVDRPVAGTIRHVVSEVQHAGVSGFSYSTVEMSSNVLMFVPLGLLLVLAFRRLPWWAAALGCAAFSGTIELSQLLFLPERVASIVDVATNTLGGTIGALLAWAVVRQLSRPAVASTGELREPGVQL